MKFELRQHPDREFVENLVSGIQQGFDTGIRHVPAGIFECQNLLSARKDSSFVTDTLKQEVESGHIVGPFTSPPFEEYRVSPIGVAEHKFSKKKRLILDLSSPHDSNDTPSINDCISSSEYSMKFVKIDDAIRIIQFLGKGAWLTKFDIKNAFRILPIAPHQWRYHCIKWDNQYYFYVRLAFGSRSSPKIFSALSEALHWIATHNYGIQHFLYLLDDFLAIDPPTDHPPSSREKLQNMFDNLEIPLNCNKTEGPAHCLTYLGVGLDCSQQVAFLPQDKLTRIRQLLENYTSKKACTKRQMLSLLGHCSFAARVVIHGRTFLSRMFQLSSTVKNLYEIVAFTRECKEDIWMWLHLLREWNGVSMFHYSDYVPTRDLMLSTDSSSNYGFGAIYGNEYIAGTWHQHPTPVSKHAMTYRELYPIICSCIVWGHLWTGKRVVFHVDNEGLVFILKKGSSYCPAINTLMRHLAILSTVHHFTYSAAWLSTDDNTLADLLSRGKFSLFQAMMPSAKRLITPPQECIMLTYPAKPSSINIRP